MPMFYINYTEFSLTRFAFHSSAPQAMLKIICYLKSVLTSKKSKQSYNIQGEVCRQTNRRTDNIFMINKMTSSLFNITFNLSLKEMRRWLKSMNFILFQRKNSQQMNILVRKHWSLLNFVIRLNSVIDIYYVLTLLHLFTFTTQRYWSEKIQMWARRIQ